MPSLVLVLPLLRRALAWWTVDSGQWTVICSLRVLASSLVRGFALLSTPAA